MTRLCRATSDEAGKIVTSYLFNLFLQISMLSLDFGLKVLVDTAGEKMVLNHF